MGLAAWLLGRGQPGVVPTQDAAFAPTTLAPILPQPEAPYDIGSPALGGVDGGIVVLLFIDGLALDRLDALLEAGDLPVLSGLMASRPSVRFTAQGTFPTSTAPSVPEVLTGRWTHRQRGGADQIHSFDRQAARLLRYEVDGHQWDGNQPTLFDHVAGAGGGTISYFEGYFPGAQLNVQDELSYLIDLAEDKVRANHIGSYDREMVADFTARLARASRAPDFVFIRFGAVDAAGHFHGPSSPQYRTALRSVDASLGHLLTHLNYATLPDGNPLADRVLFVLFSDHGMVDTHRFVGLDARLRDLGYDPWPTSTPRDVLETWANADQVHNHDVVAVPGGSNVAGIYLRARGEKERLAWSKATPQLNVRRAALPQGGTVDLLAALASTDGVELAAGPVGPHELHVIRADAAQARLFRALEPDGSWRIGYLPEPADGDLFGVCAGAPELCCTTPPSPGDACLRSVPEWLEGSADAQLPAAPFLLFKAFSGDPSRRPDLIVTAAAGASFMAQTRGDHGALQRALLEVPVVLAGPQVDPDAVLSSPRLIDLAPTLLEYLRLPGADGLDGRVLPVFRHPGAAEHEQGDVGSGAALEAPRR